MRLFIPNINDTNEKEITKLFSIGAKVGFNFKVMRTEVIFSITVFKIIVEV